MYEIVNAFLDLPVGVRFTIFLAAILIVYWIFARLFFKVIALVLLLLRKLVYGLYMLIELPISALHRIGGGAFFSIDQGLSNLFGKIYNALEKGVKGFNKPKTIHPGKAFFVFLLCGAYLTIPYFAGLYSNVFTFWEDAYLEREGRVVYFIEGTSWFEDSMPAALDVVQAGIFTGAPVDEYTEKVEIEPQLLFEVPYDFEYLSRGDSGNYVIEIQLRLQELGFYDGPISGNFGPLTEESVISFQEAMGLDPNGVFDVTAWVLLFTENN